jgi:tRNA (Thr-GGU) A37 N-methylase
VISLHPIGRIESPLVDLANAPRQGDEGAPDAIGLHRVTILMIEHTRIQVSGIEALDGTPVVDIKPVRGAER